MKNKIIENFGKDVVLVYTSSVVLTGGKKNEHQGRVTKKSKLRVTLLGNSNIYEDLQKEKNPEYVAKARPWGVRIESGLIEHKEEIYVDFIVNDYVISEYYLDDEQIDVAEIIGLKESKKSDDIDFRCVKISNILSIK